MADTAGSNSPSQHSFGRILLLAVPLGLIAWYAATKYSERYEQEAQSRLEQTMFARLVGVGEAASLDKEFQDADGDLVADPPEDEKKLINPHEIAFSYVASGETEGQEETWKEFVAALQEKLDRKVNLTIYSDAEEQMRALRNGELHITAFATGEVQSAVNTAGFVPVACFADKDDNFHYQMKVIVPADSSLNSVKDLAPTESEAGVHKHRFTFVRPRSNSGCTAALVMMVKEHDLQPERDYNWGFSYGHENSIKLVADKRTDAAAVASDMLDRMVANGQIEADSVRAIYESDPYPSGAIGYAYNLKPELRDGIRETVLNFPWEGTGLEKTYGPAGSVKFAPVSYKDDWKHVRELNQIGRDISAKLETPAA